ncbi:hypothetical protein [Paracoccus sp. MKU1]|uniref:hypothetical protein n=1 Tax=Paracoccus sp. MKU1 TaxID=1745182 RepID=UPI00137B09C9|nr:hypothetical protein [Paracoccus sp. MKU1]
MTRDRGDEIVARQRPPRPKRVPSPLGRGIESTPTSAPHPSLVPSETGAGVYRDGNGLRITEERRETRPKVDPETASPQVRGRLTPDGGFTDGRDIRRIQTEIRANTGAISPRNITGDAADEEIGRAAMSAEPISLDEAFPTPESYAPQIEERPGEPVQLPPFLRQNLQQVAKAPGENTPAARLTHVERDYPEYAQEYKLQLLHRLLLRGLPLDVIATMLGVSVKTIRAWRVTLYDRMRKEAQKIDIYGLAGQTMGFYNEVRAMAMKIASEPDKTTPAATRIHALRTALNAEADKHRFLQASGFYENTRYIPDSADMEDEIEGSAKQLGKEVMSMVAGLLGTDDHPATPKRDRQAEQDDDLRLI